MTSLSGPGPPHCPGCKIILRHTAIGRTPLDEWSARRTDLYLTTHSNHNRQTPMPPARFQPAIPASKRPQTHVLDLAATGIGSIITSQVSIHQNLCKGYRTQYSLQNENKIKNFIFSSAISNDGLKWHSQNYDALFCIYSYV